ncbi:hypothetical protein ZIOFF_075784 [Zingiber officinale]|uniref:PIFI-like Ig-like domain-containing protein n=1 Tax=Zingiber officinale TaxID=94328 RepID=A0A8J5E8A1_ZINOF|nr:hypothetical protein ZIOFF_075784 [Zingiber officinale]
MRDHRISGHLLHPKSFKTPFFQTLAQTLQHFIESNSPSKGQTLHAKIITFGLHPNTNLFIKLLILHLRCRSFLHARKLFDQMPRRTLSAYNYMIAGYFKEGRVEESLDLIRKLLASNQKPDGFTLSMALKLSASLGLWNLPREIHAQIVRLGIGSSDEVVIAALVDSYVKNGNLQYARSVFDSMPEPERNLICSTALVVGYMNQGEFNEAEHIFRSSKEKDVILFNAMIEGYSRGLDTCVNSIEMYKMMQRLNYLPTISSFVSVIGACALSSASEVGEQIHGQMAKMEALSHVKCGSALVDMYSKCGKVADARKMFDEMPEQNVFTWTSMIDGYGKNGIPNLALTLFYKMKDCCNDRPNHATFLSVLSACGHAGLVSNGRQIFESMEREYKLKPRIEHYACMVDLLGRSGNLSEAYRFIEQMPMKPNSDVWTALLGAASIHGNVVMADVAAKEVFKLSRNERPGAYVVLSNTFAAAEKWKGVSKVRKLMKAMGVSKGTGQSWVDVNKAATLVGAYSVTYGPKQRCCRRIQAAAVVSAPVEEELKEYILPSWSEFELGIAPVFWKTMNGLPPTSGESLTLFYNPVSSKLIPNDEYGVAFNEFFFCLHCAAVNLIFSFTNGVDWDGPYKLQFQTLKMWRNRPISFFNAGLAQELSAEGACDRAIYPDPNNFVASCAIGNLYAEGGNSCKLNLVPGCMDPSSLFFNPLANVDDGSCPLDTDPDEE